MPAKKTHDELLDKLATIRALAEESEALLKEQSPNVERLLATLQAQSGLQQALLEKLLEVVHPTDKEKDLSDTFQAAVQELLDYFRERVKLRGKVADAAALKHLRKE